jgi:hypothetical protein
VAGGEAERLAGDDRLVLRFRGDGTCREAKTNVIWLKILQSFGLSSWKLRSCNDGFAIDYGRWRRYGGSGPLRG